MVRLLTLLCQLAATQPASQPAPPRAPARALVVVAPQALSVPALFWFCAARHEALPTQLFTLETILPTQAGADDPEKLKRFLFTRWRDHGLRYVLLVGDADLMPVRFMALDRVTPAAFDTAFYPSDLYYADVARQDGSFESWNQASEGFHAGYFGEVHGEKHKDGPINFDQVDYLPELAVGRWPVSTAAEVERLVRKTLVFEAASESRPAPGPASRPTAGFVVHGGWVDARALLDQLAGRLPDGWAAERRFYADAARNDHTPPPDSAQVLALLTGGVRLLCHAGHGEADRWDGCLSVGALDQLAHQARLGVLFSAGCTTARLCTLPPYEPYEDTAGVPHRGTNHGEVFTAPPPAPSPYQRGAHNPTSLGEQLLRRGEPGAVAYIGCDTGSQPCALSLMEGFVGALRTSSTGRLGDLWVDAVHHYWKKERLAELRPTADWYPPSVFFQGMKFLVLGDPTLPLVIPGR
jgi:hypothetical protein